MSMYMYLDLGVETKIFHKILAVVVSAVGVITSPGTQLDSPQLLIWRIWDSLFVAGSLPQCGHM